MNWFKIDPKTEIPKGAAIAAASIGGLLGLTIGGWINGWWF